MTLRLVTLLTFVHVLTSSAGISIRALFTARHPVALHAGGTRAYVATVKTPSRVVTCCCIRISASFRIGILQEIINVNNIFLFNNVILCFSLAFKTY